MFAAESLERPTLVRTASGRWRLYVSCATPGTKHWRIDAVEADTPAELSSATAVTVWPGDERTAVKDPVIRRSANGWRAWVYPFGEAGLVADADAPASPARYLEVFESAAGYRIYYEAPLPDGSHELRTEFMPIRQLP